MKENIFQRLFKPKTKKGQIVDIKEKYRVSKITAYDGIPTVYYDILLHDSKQKVGTIDLRLTVEGFMYYYGNIGYNVIEKYRGNNYAYYACMLLFKVAKKEFGLDTLLVTCSPDNIASKKTLEKLHGTLIAKVDVPEQHELYKLGEKRKYVYKFNI